jgi:hypothetical protein
MGVRQAEDVIRASRCGRSDCSAPVKAQARRRLSGEVYKEAMRRNSAALIVAHNRH